MPPSDRRPWLFPSLAAALVCVFLWQCFLTSSVKTPNFDEPCHISAGLSYVTTRKFVANLQHPPLLKELIGLFTLASGARWPDTEHAQMLLAGESRYQWLVGDEIIMANQPDNVMFWARLPMILVGAMLAVLLYVWGSRMAGAAAAVGAVFLCALDPTIVAHASLTTLDVGFAAFTILFLFALWSYLRFPTMKRLVLCGLALGAVLSTKFSAVALLPVAALLVIAAMWRPPAQSASAPHGFVNLYGASPAQRATTGILALALMGLAAVFVVEALYFFPDDPFLYLKGMSLVNADHLTGYLAYMAGRLAPRFPSYFAVAWLLKTPIASIVLAILGLVLVARSKSLELLDKLFLLLPPAVLFAAHVLRADNLGFRYIIPVLPFTYLLGGVALAELIGSHVVWKQAVAGVLCVWLIVAAIGIHPDQLSYFNEAACLLDQPGKIGLDGGSRCGASWLEDSNVDWGGGLKQLRDWWNQNALGRPLKFAYFGTFPPEIYGLRYELAEMPALVVKTPPPGLWAVSASMVARAPAVGRNGDGEWLLRTRPIAIVGHCLYIYDIK